MAITPKLFKMGHFLKVIIKIYFFKINTTIGLFGKNWLDKFYFFNMLLF